jgi:glycosyltransferase involved in cell wall biosynthesis
VSNLIDEKEKIVSFGLGPLVTILMGTKNGERFLAEQLDSLADQSHQNWVLIASDDGSTDQTLAILHSYQAKWSDGKLIIKEGPQQGFCVNYLSMACDPVIKADFYAFCDQDDVWLPTKLEVGLSSLVANASSGNPIPMLYGGKTIYVDENLKELGQSSSFNYPKVFRNALVQTMAGGNTLIFNQVSKVMIEKTRDTYPASHDWWLYLLISGANGICIFDVCPQVLYRQHRNSLVGENRTFLAKIKRVYSLLGGRYKELVEMNIVALTQHKELLTKDALDLLNTFIIMRQSSLLMRLRLLSVCGLFRQTRNGTVALLIAVFFNLI